MMLAAGLVSSSFAMSPILMGDFESGSVIHSSQDIRWDGWMVNLNSSAVTVPAVAATRGTHSLKWVDLDGGDWLADSITYPFGATLDERLEAWLNPGSAITVDVTAIPDEVTGGWAALGLFFNAAGGWGFDDTTWQDIIVDGTPHTYVFYVTERVREVILDSIGGWGCNLGFGMRTAAGEAITLYLDNIWIYPDGPTAHLFPHAPSYDEVISLDPDYSDITLKWKAPADPGDPNRLPDPNVIYAVHPDIVDQYVFMAELGSPDPNLYYVGNTGIDPGTDDPDSEFGILTLPVNSAYRWAVVSVLDGYEQVLTPTVSRLIDVDTRNIIGPVWTLQTRMTTPQIHTQPVSTRFGVNDAEAQFTVGVDMGYAPSYQWYYSLDAVIDDGDVPISQAIGGNTDTMTISARNKAYQAYYYCRVWNDSTVSGGGTQPDVYSDIVSLVVERKVAEYLFDGNFNDTSTMAFHGAGVGSPTFVSGVGDSGQALSLDGSTQYVVLGDPADPNTFNKAFPRADLLAEGGIGGGLDVGSITCWIKLNPTAADQISPIMFNANGGWPHTEFRFEIPTDSAAANTNLRSYIWGDTGDLLFWMDVNPVWADPFNMGGDGQWHMLALTWDMNGTVKSYVNGNLLASWNAGPSVFSAWNNAPMRIGFDGDNYFGGLIDNLRVYNYEITAEEIVEEYYSVTGQPGCIYDFAGSALNVNQLGSSYCRLDLADLAAFAAYWLNDGFYTPVP